MKRMESLVDLQVPRTGEATGRRTMNQVLGAIEGIMVPASSWGAECMMFWVSIHHSSGFKLHLSKMLH